MQQNCRFEITPLHLLVEFKHLFSFLQDFSNNNTEIGIPAKKCFVLLFPLIFQK